jgi:hypothetical protein
MLIQIVLFHGFDELDVVAPFEVLKNTARLTCQDAGIISGRGATAIEFG